MTDSTKEQGHKAASAAGRRDPKRKTESRSSRPGRGRRTNRRRSRNAKRTEQGNGQKGSPEARSHRQTESKKKGTGSSRRKRNGSGSARGRNRRQSSKRVRNRQMTPDTAQQQEAMQPDADYVPPDAVFLYTHVRRQSYRDFEQESLQRPRWFTRVASDSSYPG